MSESPPEPQAVSVPARRSIPKLLVYAMPVLLAASAAAASTMLVKRQEAEPEFHAVPVTPEQMPLLFDNVSIDTLICAGAYQTALDRILNAPAPASAADQRSLAYREAVCLEALERYQEASEAYRRAEPKDGDQAAWARATLGQARCAAANRDHHLARTLLDRTLLRTGHPDCVGTNIYEECVYCRVRFEAMRMTRVRAIDPFDATAPAWPPLSIRHDRYFEWLKPDTPPSGSVGPPMPNAIAVRQAATVPGGYEITAHYPESFLPNLLVAIADAAGLKLMLDQKAAAILTTEMESLAVEHLPLRELLDALTHRFGMDWVIENGTLSVTTSLAESQQQRGAITQSLQHVLATAPRHPHVAELRTWLANLLFVDGKARDAVKEYLQVLNDAPESPAVPFALYNLGLAELGLGDVHSARSRFMNLIDAAPRSRWSEYGWWWVGRTHLDCGNQAAARKAFRLARDGRTREVGSAAGLAVCVCELLEGHDEAAGAILSSLRVSPRQDHANLEAVLERLLKYRAAPTPNRRDRLLDAIHEACEARHLGPAGMLLTGNVYRELDVPERAVKLFDDASAAVRGPLAVRMTFDAAELYDRLGKAELARQRYLAVVAVDASGLGVPAELRLAEMAFKDQQLEECLLRCRRLLERSDEDRTRILSLMGRCYELRKNYRLAAECFAGRVPLE